MQYFSHDTSAHKDEKIMLLRRRHGGAAVDAYWTILEIMYRDETQMKPTQNPIGFESVSMFLQCSVEELEKWVETMCSLGLLDCAEDEDGGYAIFSHRAMKNIEGYQDRVEKNRENGGKGGRPKKNAGENHAKTEKNPVGSESVNEKNQSETDGEPNDNQIGGISKSKSKSKSNEEERNKEEATDEQDDRFNAFLKSAIAIFNEETESSLLCFSPAVHMKVRRIFDSGRTLDDVRLVCADLYDRWKDDQKWQPWIRPETFFGDKFESYLNVAAKRAEDSRKAVDRYAQYA